MKLAECKLSSSIQEQVIEVQGGERFRIEHSPPAPVEHSVQRCLLFRFTIVLAESHGSQSRWFGFLVSQREAAFVFRGLGTLPVSTFTFYGLPRLRARDHRGKRTIHVFHGRAKRELWPCFLFDDETRETLDSIRFIVLSFAPSGFSSIRTDLVLWSAMLKRNIDWNLTLETVNSFTT